MSNVNNIAGKDWSEALRKVFVLCVLCLLICLVWWFVQTHPTTISITIGDK
jgi:hypothetical protein